MATSLFSVSIFFVVFREALETALIISVLLSLVEQVLHTPAPGDRSEPGTTPVPPRVVRKLKLQIIFGALVGLVVAIAIGAAFVAVWFTQAKNLWSGSEQLWEGIFQLIASIMIFIMGVTMLKMEHARTKWRIKLQNAFNGQQRDSGAKTGRWVLFILPLITVLRLEAVVFVGGVSLAEPATSIPIAAIVGIICGLACGVIVYQSASRTTFKIFLVCMTNTILLIGAGLFSKAVWAFQENNFIRIIGASSDEAIGNGPGTYDVRGNVWHLDCCSPSSGGWSIFYAVFGWENSATLGSVLSYVFYWLAVIAVLVYYKFREGRTKLFGWESANGKKRRQQREEGASRNTTESSSEKDLQADMVGLPKP